MDAKQDQNRSDMDAPSPATPLSPIEAHRAEDEARRQAAMSGAELFRTQHRGKVEAETRRISEEVTRAARERLLAAQASSRAGEPPVGRSERATNEQATGIPATRFPPPITIKHVAVALDGSSFAERALPYAAAVARMTGAHLALAHVDSIPGALDTLIASSSSVSQQRQAEGMRPSLEALRQRVPLQRQRIHIAIQRASSPAQGISALEEEGLADLVVMTTHARQGVQRMLLGSVADALLRSGRAPVLVVPPQVAQPVEGTPTFSHVLIPLDGSPLSEQALGALGGLLAVAPDAERTLREITLLTVVEHPALMEDGEAYLAAVRRQVETEYPTQGLSVRTVTMVGDAAAIIAGLAPREGAPVNAPLLADLLVMATHGRGGVSRWLLGSVASSVLPRIALPVLLVRPLTMV